MEIANCKLEIGWMFVTYIDNIHVYVAKEKWNKKNQW